MVAGTPPAGCGRVHFLISSEMQASTKPLLSVLVFMIRTDVTRPVGPTSISTHTLPASWESSMRARSTQSWSASKWRPTTRRVAASSILPGLGGGAEGIDVRGVSGFSIVGSAVPALVGAGATGAVPVTGAGAADDEATVAVVELASSPDEAGLVLDRSGDRELGREEGRTGSRVTSTRRS